MPSTDYRALNKLSLKFKATDVKSQLEFRKLHDIRTRSPMPHKTPLSVFSERTFGKPSGSDDPITMIINHQYAGNEKPINVRSRSVAREVHPLPRPKAKEDTHHPFKMKRFLRVPPKLSSSNA
jgi:hypothetical protein